MTEVTRREVFAGAMLKSLSFRHYETVNRDQYVPLSKRQRERETKIYQYEYANI